MTTHAQEILLRLHQPLELEGRVQEIIDNVRREAFAEAVKIAREYFSSPGNFRLEHAEEIAAAIEAKAKEKQQ